MMDLHTKPWSYLTTNPVIKGAEKLLDEAGCMSLWNQAGWALSEVLFFSKSNFNEYLILYLPSLCFSLTGCYFRNRVQWDKTTSHFWVGPEAWVSMAVALGAVFGELVPSQAAETLLWISSSWQLRLMVLCVWTGVRRAPFLISLFWGARKPAWGTDWFWQNLGVHWTSVRCFRESFSILNDKSANSGFDLLLRWS